MANELKNTLNTLYTGQNAGAKRFRYALIVFDALSILFFIITAPFPHQSTVTDISHVHGILILLDFSARLWIAPDRLAMFKKIYTLADVIVIFSLLLDPLYSGSLAFLRILRGLRVIHAYHLLRDLRQDSVFFRLHEEALIAAVNLFVFVFVTTSVVYSLFFDSVRGTEAYIDALYFTVATLTTTGFGDITMTSAAGKLFSVFTMVVGVALFVQLAKAIFRPAKVVYPCPQCGLTRHDIDAVHCKHCGGTVKIETGGAI